MQKLAKSAILLLWLACEAAASSTFVLETGEIIKGVVLTKTAENVEVRTAYGDIKIPYTAIKTETVDDPPPSANSDTTSENGAAETLDIENGIGIEEVGIEPPALFPDSGSTNDAKDTLETKIISWKKQYRTFLESWVPEGWDFNLRGGATIEHTTTSKTLFSFGGSAKREWDEFFYSFDAFYDYETQTDTAGVTSTTTDKYGANSDFRWNFLGENSDWFFSNIISYRHDGIKQIYDQIDNAVGLGYSFELPEWGIKWDVSFGPAVRYIDAYDYDYHWIPMAILNEQLTWDITDILRFEHKGYMGMGLTTGNEGTIYIMVGLVFMPEEIVSLALRYTNDYDSINSPSAIKNEQRLIFSIEIPIRGRR